MLKEDSKDKNKDSGSIYCIRPDDKKSHQFIKVVFPALDKNRFEKYEKLMNDLKIHDICQSKKNNNVITKFSVNRPFFGFTSYYYVNIPYQINSCKSELLEQFKIKTDDCTKLEDGWYYFSWFVPR